MCLIYRYRKQTARIDLSLSRISDNFRNDGRARTIRNTGTSAHSVFDNFIHFRRKFPGESTRGPLHIIFTDLADLSILMEWASLARGRQVSRVYTRVSKRQLAFSKFFLESSRPRQINLWDKNPCIRPGPAGARSDVYAISEKKRPFWEKTRIMHNAWEIGE